MSTGDQFRNQFHDHPDDPRAPPFKGFDTFGTGDLLPLALQVLVRNVNDAGWSLEVLRPLRVGRFNAMQAHRVWLEDPNDKEHSYIVPLAAKSYAINRGYSWGAYSWYSVSESVLGASAEFGSDIVLTFIHQLGSIRVTQRRTAQAEGNYTRMGERYSGWKLSDSLALEDWLRNPSALSYQESLFPC